MKEFYANIITLHKFTQYGETKYTVVFNILNMNCSIMLLCEKEDYYKLKYGTVYLVKKEDKKIKSIKEA